MALGVTLTVPLRRGRFEYHRGSVARALQGEDPSLPVDTLFAVMHE
jgi:hypothetical protein